MNHANYMNLPRITCFVNASASEATLFRSENDGTLEPIHHLRHAHGGDRSHAETDAERFAKEIVAQLSKDQQAQHFDEIVLMANPHFLGLLRKSLPATLKEKVKKEVHKEILHLAPQTTGKEIRALS